VFFLSFEIYNRLSV